MTPLEKQLQSCLGDWVSQYNPMERCGICDGFHEEPVRILMAVKKWSCYKAQAYEQIVRRMLVDHCRVQDFKRARRKAERIAPHWRRGIHPRMEKDSDFLSRMVQLHLEDPDLDLILFNEGLTPLERKAFFGETTNGKILARKNTPRRSLGQSCAKGAKKGANPYGKNNRGTGKGSY